MVCWGIQHSGWLLIPWFPFEWFFSNSVVEILCPPPDSIWFQSLPPSNRNRFLADLSSAKAAIQGGVVRSKLSLGEDTCYIYCPLEFQMIHSSNNFRRGNVTESLEPSLPHLERVDFLLQNLLHSEVTQSAPPWTAFHRPLSWLTSQIQDSTMMETLHSFYSVNFDATSL